MYAMDGEGITGILIQNITYKSLPIKQQELQVAYLSLRTIFGPQLNPINRGTTKSI